MRARSLSPSRSTGIAPDFPAYSARTGTEITLPDRLNSCMRRSMNGRPMPADLPEMLALVAYIDFLSTGVPDSVSCGAMARDKCRCSTAPPTPREASRSMPPKCVACHGESGEGVRRSLPSTDLGYMVPPLWGPDSFNDGAGMNRLITAANFLHSNMPHGTDYLHPTADAGGGLGRRGLYPRPAAAGDGRARQGLPGAVDEALRHALRALGGRFPGGASPLRPVPAAVRPGWRPAFEFGGIRVDRIVEMEIPIRPAKVFLPGLTEEQLAANRAWLQRSGALDARDWLVLCFQSYVVRTPHHTILVDTCVGNDQPGRSHPMFNGRSDGAYMQGLAAAGLSVGRHRHRHVHASARGSRRLEHAAGERPLGAHLSQGPLPVLGGRVPTSGQDGTHRSRRRHFADTVLPIVEAGRHDFVGSADAVDDQSASCRRRATRPTISAWSSARARDAGVITGDVIHSPLQARYPELWMKDDVDPAQAVRTRRAFLERYCDTDTVCCTAHFPSPSLTRVRRWDDGFRCDPV